MIGLATNLPIPLKIGRASVYRVLAAGDRRSPSKQCFKGLGQLPLSATLTALATLLAGLVTAIGILALLTRGVLATLLAALTLIFFATVLTAALLLATLVLLAALVLATLLVPAMVLFVAILIHEYFSLVTPHLCQLADKGWVPAGPKDAMNLRMH